MDLQNVVITGVGPVSAIGSGREAFWSALRSGQPGFGPITLCDTEGLESTIAAEVKGFDLTTYLPEARASVRRMPRMVQLTLAAAALALEDSGLDLDGCGRDRVGVHVGTSIANIATSFEMRDALLEYHRISAHSAFFGFNHSAACLTSATFDLRGPLHTTSSGCNSGLDALGDAAQDIRLGEAEAMLVIGSDCEVVQEIVMALARSGSLATRYNDRPAIASRPFDTERDGNVIGEGAGALLLESESHARQRGARVYARLAAYRSAAAGSHREYSHDDPDLDVAPCVRAMGGAVGAAGWRPEQVDLVNANGSASKLYDRLEAQALGELFGARLPELPLHSIKSMLGQHGAGSSALQAISACLAIAEGEVPPTINHDALDPACGPLQVVTRLRAMPIERCLVHAIGMGGFYYSAAAFERG
ncbi:MAG: beta-ketoacyl-[acyl-carrier-protein] synthase family protein [Caldilineae bacterium]|nr:beta-ketoacyl-[acyl-carrier-protein] synthase family protein [Chloroflexota bacterium]MCB9177416.1 beta-ketoacyl-[acyl-carrier-protein] synthase family protein [Caldilineae bacterium]